ncbi:uncharacterized protein LOC112044297 [Bicyclus anynana]|uniref:Uncharacterized protein LOC112044297 n=1 Tax=Bicyclus anynana TaxID=110368 RepID=A0A6J1MZ66_BICAN|nr:uncharacterized protein LOC112044297 [Bicyclus anynana]
MSIPPFVCSTPPPPEQCEDDKDHEDFDITYSLSQEDDDDSTDYNNYGNYSSYNIYQNTSETVKKEEWNTNLSNKSESTCETKIKPEEILNAVNFITNNEIVDETIPKFEDMVVEDLNLIVDKDIVHSTDMVSKEFETEVDDEIECSNKQARIQDEGGTKITANVNIESHVSSNIPESIDFSDRSENFQIDTVENVNVTNDVLQISSVNELPGDKKSENEENIFTGEVVNTFLEHPKPLDQEVIAVIDESPTDDDFGDFEDFQFTSTSENSQPLNVNSENPWESDCIEGPMFGDFTANFDNDTKPVVEREAKELEELKTDTSPKEDEDDDFGDFDDFRSSDKTESVVDTNEVTSTPDVTLWNLSSPDNDPQIVDSINSVLVPIFVDEIPSPVNELCGMLESFLGETWGHMVDIEVRQPYMVSWNNSLGQKTLLKALCIDSRNILFGPKWNYNMPKYATNLTAAPLQPQKQIAPSTSSSDTVERVINKEAGAWVDPFTPDGQQSCNTENKSMATETATRPTDLEVFESDTSAKMSKIYSSTMNVQPLRHINLPDTHIFTPTDSETPRSKTIHYDSGPSGLIPQPVLESSKNKTEILPSQLNENVDKEYWDFQDFKGANTTVSPNNTTQTTEESSFNTTDNILPKSSTTYQTQILQPIKLDPIIPTLNWPDPGEVKETFDDFSDFISSTSWNNDKDNQAGTFDTRKDVQTKQPTEVTTENVDDDFETFQSAPAGTSAMNFSLNTIVGSQISLQDNLTTKTMDNCDNPLNMESQTSLKPNLNLENQSSSMSNNVPIIQDFSFPQAPPIQSISTEILQPTTSNSGMSRQHKSDQILQPLSLESYSQINWPNPGIDLQDLSRFNPINSLHSLKSDSSTGNSKNSSPAHNSGSVSNQPTDDDIWGDFVSSAPKQHPTPKKTFADDDEWTDFVSSPSMKPQNGLNTISFNVHTNLSMQKTSGQNNFAPRSNQMPLDIPTLNYITPKSSNRGLYSEKHLQNL